MVKINKRIYGKREEISFDIDYVFLTNYKNNLNIIIFIIIKNSDFLFFNNK